MINETNKILSPVSYIRELFAFKDEGTIAIDWSEDVSFSSKPILCIFPGLGGDHNDIYLTNTVKDFENQFTCVIINYRGSAGVSLTVSPYFGLFTIVPTPLFSRQCQ